MQAVRRPKQQPVKAARTKVKSGAPKLEEDQTLVTLRSSVQVTKQLVKGGLTSVFYLRSAHLLTPAEVRLGLAKVAGVGCRSIFPEEAFEWVALFPTPSTEPGHQPEGDTRPVPRFKKGYSPTVDKLITVLVSCHLGL